MGRMTQELRAGWPHLLLGLAGVAVCYALVRWYSDQTASLPVAILLIPVMAVALWGAPWPTGLTAVAALAVGTVLFVAHEPQRDLLLRYIALLIGCVLATALAAARRRREDAIAEQKAELEIARRREASERLMADMLERLPELSGAATVDDVTDRACGLAREVFGADAASYWTIDGDDAVLVSRDPSGRVPRGTRLPRSELNPGPHTDLESRTSWASLRGLPEDDARRRRLQAFGASAGASTPVRVDFETVGILALSWANDVADPDRGWFERLERFADQTALAKTVVRRAIAQQESRDLTDRLQASFMPASVRDVPNARVSLLYRPGLSQMLMGGDFLDVTVDGDGGTAFLIGDVSGHGPEQAALAAVVRAAWRGALGVPGTSLKDWVLALEAVVQDRSPSPGLFVTAVTGCLDREMRTLEYISAGHPPPVLLPSGRLAPLGGLPVGLPHLTSSQDVHTVALDGTDAVLLVTDGLFEGLLPGSGGERLGVDGFVDLAANHWRASDDHGPFLGELADRLEEMNGGPLVDDAAALLLERP